MTGHPDQEAIYEEIADITEDLHQLVAKLAIYPPEIVAIVCRNALKDTRIRGKRKARIAGFFRNEVRALRAARAAGDPVPFEQPAEPGKEAA